MSSVLKLKRRAFASLSLAPRQPTTTRMKVIVTGASGLLGRPTFAAFKAAGHVVTGTAFNRSGPGLVKIDLENKEALEKLIEDVKPEVVVHCAAERRPDVAEANPEAVKKLNVALPAHLSLLSKSPTAPFYLIYISTDYVFPGEARPAGYEPNDVVDPTNLYGITKELGEREVVGGGGKGCVLRVPVLYGPTEKNSESAINILLDNTRAAAKGDKEVKMDNWATRYPTNVLDVARVLVDLSEMAQKTPEGIPPILHFSTQSLYTKYDISLLLASLHSPPLDTSKIVAVNSGPDVGKGETRRPRDCHLSNKEIEKLGIDTKGVDFKEWWVQWLEKEKVN